MELFHKGMLESLLDSNSFIRVESQTSFQKINSDRVLIMKKGLETPLIFDMDTVDDRKRVFRVYLTDIVVSRFPDNFYD